MAMLDEECLRPGTVTDSTFLEKLNQVCADHQHFESRMSKSSKFLNDHSLPHNCFRIQHYAGKVLYHVEGFMDKNNDLLYRDLSQAMWKANHSLIKSLFPDGNPAKINLKRPPTAGSQFKTSVATLMKNLQTKNPNYIRCIKPNDQKASHIFTDSLVCHQVRYLGLMENVRVRRAGYAFRQPYEACLERYKMLCKQTWPHWRGQARDGVEVLLKDLQIPAEEYSYGRSKIFIRNPRTLFSLEEQRKRRLHGLATLIQKIFRGWKTRTRFLLMKSSQVTVAAWYRRYAQQKKYKKTKSSAVIVQSFIRGWKARKILRELKYQKRCEEAVTTIGAYWHGTRARRELKRLKEEARCKHAVDVIWAYWLGLKVRREYRKFFRAHAGKRIYEFTIQRIMQKYFLELKNKTPSMSPSDKTWPARPYLFLDSTHKELRRIFHLWRCKKYRGQFTDQKKAIYEEKLEASEIFKDKKALYPSSVAQPFQGDYLEINKNPRYQKLNSLVEEKIIFADVVNKINRANGKANPAAHTIQPTGTPVMQSCPVAVDCVLCADPAAHTIQPTGTPVMQSCPVAVDCVLCADPAAHTIQPTGCLVMQSCPVAVDCVLCADPAAHTIQPTGTPVMQSCPVAVDCVLCADPAAHTIQPTGTPVMQSCIICSICSSTAVFYHIWRAFQG
ncbi:Unconventional myosin-Ib [Acipenser ruthenus]|uniref:Unconventional myosin-Ib n=1 Tax=Acipenser ruthenus TaxID=7906 RepID=A0A662YTT7_ACIRT|nr:Unconventional myosin-Ib [Acipenser ruthenus]